MKLEFRSSFIRDLRRIRNADVLDRVRSVIEELEAAPAIAEIPSASRIKT